MPSILITTSRRTSNRVRTFIQDLHRNFPDSLRFNRGSLSKEEIISRVRKTNAKGVVIVSQYRGNPGELEVYDATGETMVRLRIESALLRREVQSGSPVRVNGEIPVIIRNDSCEGTRTVADIVSKLLGSSVIEAPSIESVVISRFIFHWFEDYPNERIFWTTYESKTKKELGPRMRILPLEVP